MSLRPLPSPERLPVHPRGGMQQHDRVRHDDVRTSGGSFRPSRPFPVLAVLDLRSFMPVSRFAVSAMHVRTHGFDNWISLSRAALRFAPYAQVPMA